MTTSFPAGISSRGTSALTILFSCAAAILQSGCVRDLDIGGNQAMQVTDPGTSTSTGTGTSTQMHVGPNPTATLTSTQTDLSVEPLCERINLHLNALNPCGSITSLAYSPDGAYLASSSYDVSADTVVWRVNDGQRVARFAAKDWGRSFAVAFSPDGKHLAAGGYTRAGDPGALRLWDLGTGSLVYSLHSTITGYAGAVAWSPDGNLLAVGGEFGVVEVWDVPRGQLARKLDTGGSTENVHFSPDGSRLIAASTDGQARIWNVSDWSAVGFTLTIADEMADASYSPDQLQIASTGWTDVGAAEVRLWDATTGTLLQALSMGTALMSHTLWSSQGILFANDCGGVVRAWTRQSDGRLASSGTWSTGGSATGKLRLSIALAISPQGTGLVAGGMDPATNAHGFMFLSM